MFQNALRIYLNAFKRFEMRCAEKWLNANFVKPVFPKDGHIHVYRNWAITHNLVFQG